MANDQSHVGSCLCGSVRYRVDGNLSAIVACHCGQCRKQTGHFYASTNAARQDLSVEGEDALSWYQSSAKARRGFCSKCGSALFWDHEDDATIGILAGSLDGPTDLKVAKHIYCADKGDYYQIPDGEPAFDIR